MARLLLAVIALSALLAVASASHGSLAWLLPINATCSDVNQVRISCVDESMGCNDTIGALEQAERGLTVYLCREGLNCQLPPAGFSGSSSYVCAQTARIGELCGCAAMDRDCASLACYEPAYQVACLNALCRGQNVYGAGEPASFKQDAVCDRSSNAPFPNGGCLAYSSVDESLICESTTGHCSALDTGDSCAPPKQNWCRYDAYCNADTQLCTVRATSPSAACNYTTDGPHACGPLLSCRPDNKCEEWFSGDVGASCGSLVDCKQDLYCNGATGLCTETSTATTCTHPNEIAECTAGTCVCNGDRGSCEVEAVTSQLISRWNALVTCVSENKCFPVAYNNGPVSPAGLQYFPGSCYDSFCRKQWQALQSDEAICHSMAAVHSISVSLLLVVAIVAYLL